MSEVKYIPVCCLPGMIDIEETEEGKILITCKKTGKKFLVPKFVIFNTKVEISSIHFPVDSEVI